MQAAEIFGEAAARVGLQERGSGEKKRDLIIADQFAYGGEVERAGMIGHADGEDCGQPESDGEAERMEEGQHAEKDVAFGEHESLAHLINVGHDVVVSEHHAFGFAGAAAGKNNCGEIVERLRFSGAESAFEQRAGQEPQQ